MSTARLKLILWTAVAGLSLAAALVLAAAVAMPLDVPEAAGPVGPVANDRASSKAPGVPPLASFEAAWSVDLRRPLVDPPPRAAVPATSSGVAANPPVRLVGVVTSGGRRRGLFLTTGGKVELRGPGEKAGGADVVSVDEKGATLTHDGRPLTLRLEPAPAARGPSLPAVVPSGRSTAANGAGS